jgi:hypothetical protein
MESTQSWQPLLRTPRPCDHLIQLYTDEAFLTRAVTHFVGCGLAEGEAAVIIATPPHVDAFKERLAAGVDLAEALARDQLVILDAESCLAQFMVEGTPDRAAFFAVVNAVLDRVRNAGHDRIRLFGEMVNLLWDHNLAATVQLEGLWNEVLADHRVCLLCAYRIDNFDRHAHRGMLHQISRYHSHFIPVEDYGRLEEAVDRAYHDVFGKTGDARGLRDLFVSQHPSAPLMPSGQAALHALRGLQDTIADQVLERTSRYYKGSGTSALRS